MYNVIEIIEIIKTVAGYLACLMVLYFVLKFLYRNITIE